MPPFKPTLPRPSGNGNPSAFAAHLTTTRLRVASENDSDDPRLPPTDEDLSDLASTWEDLATAVGEVKWLVKGWVPYGMLTGLIGESKCGKSAFALHALIRPVVTGCDWFNGGKSGEPGRVLYCDTERSGIINAERMQAWGIPRERVLTPFKDFHRVLDIANDGHLAHLRNVITRGGIRLVLIDSLRGSHRGQENDSQLANHLYDLGQVAQETGVAVVIIHHTRKPSVEQVETGKHDGRGTTGILAALRHQVVIDMPKGHDYPWRRVQVIGTNLGRQPTPVGYKITDAGVEYGTAPTAERKKTEKATIKEWLVNYMSRGETYLAKDVLAAGEEAGHAERTVQEAAEDLGVIKEQSREGGRIRGWTWTLPE